MSQLVYSDNLTDDVYKRIIGGKTQEGDLKALNTWYNDLIRRMKSDDFFKRMIQGFSLSERKKPLMVVASDETQVDSNQKLMDFFSHCLTEGDNSNVDDLPAKLREIYDNMIRLINLSKVDNAWLLRGLLGDLYCTNENGKISIKEVLPLPEEGYFNIVNRIANSKTMPQIDDFRIMELLCANSNVPPFVLYKLADTVVKHYYSIPKENRENHPTYCSLVDVLKRIAGCNNTPVITLGKIQEVVCGNGLFHDHVSSSATENLCQRFKTNNGNTRVYISGRCESVGECQENAMALIKKGLEDKVSKFMRKGDLNDFENLVMGLLLGTDDEDDINYNKDRIGEAIIKMYNSIYSGKEPEQSENPLTNSLIAYMEASLKGRAIALRSEKSSLQGLLERVRNLFKKIRVGGIDGFDGR